MKGTAARWTLPLAAASSIVALGLACSGGGPAVPAGQVVLDTYVRARVTVLDAQTPCAPPPGTCAPEFYSCSDLSPVMVGATYAFAADAAAAGVTSPERCRTMNAVLNGTDFASKVGISVGITLCVDPANPACMLALPARLGTEINSTFADVDTTCRKVNSLNVPETRFQLVAGDPRNQVTVTRIDTVAGASCDPTSPSSMTGTAFVAGTQTAAGTFSPAGIIEGTFTFVGENRQDSPTGVLTARALVEGCFKLNFPAGIQGVPVTRAAAAPGGCP